jgi:hypothetical protein
MIHIFEELTNEQAGQLMKHIFKYVNDQEPVLQDQILKVSFAPIKAQLKRDLDEWRKTCNRNSENGKKGGRPPKSEGLIQEPKKPTGLFGNPKNPLKPDNDKDNDNEKDISINELSIDSVRNSFSSQGINSLPYFHSIGKAHKLKHSRIEEHFEKWALASIDSMKDLNHCKKSFNLYLENIKKDDLDDPNLPSNMYPKSNFKDNWW